MSAEVSDRGQAVRSRDDRSHSGRKAAIMTLPTSGATARRMFGLVEPIGMIPYATDEPAEARRAVGLRDYCATSFAGRAAPLGRAPAEVVHAIFYNFAPGEAARHIPRVWDLITPEEALAARPQ